MWCSPIVLFVKKDGSIQFCVDYPKVNQVSQFDTFSMPWVNKLPDQLGTAHFFLMLDLTKGYWQIPLPCLSPRKKRPSAGGFVQALCGELLLYMPISYFELFTQAPDVF